MKLSITKTMAAGLVVLQLVTVCIVLASSYITTEKVLVGHAQSLMRNLSREVIGRSEEFLLPARSAVSLTRSLARHQVVSETQPEAMERYFFEQLVLNSHIAGIYFGNLNGNFHFVRRSNDIASFQIKRITEVNGTRAVDNRWYDLDFNLLDQLTDPNDRYDPRTRPWFVKALAERKQVWTEPYVFFTSQTPGITVASPVYSEQGSIVGVVGVDIDLTSLSDFLNQLELTTGASALIMNNNGDIVAHRNLGKSFIKDPVSGENRLLRINEVGLPASVAAVDSLGMKEGWFLLNTAQTATFEHNERHYHSVFTPFSENWPWLLGIYMPEDDFLSEVQQNQQQNLLVAILVTTISVFICILFAKSLSKPILAIQRGVQAVRRGEYEIDMDTQKSYFNDIAETSEAFGDMLNVLKANKLSNEQLQKELKSQARVMESALGFIEDGVVVSDIHGSIIFANSVAREMRGLEPSARFDKLDDAPVEIFTADEAKRIAHERWPLARTLAGDRVDGEEIVIVSPDGKKHRVRAFGSLIISEEDGHVGAVIRLKRISYL